MTTKNKIPQSVCPFCGENAIIVGSKGKCSDPYQECGCEFQIKCNISIEHFSVINDYIENPSQKITFNDYEEL